MIYGQVRRAEFIRRPNRFNAVCLLEGQETMVHVRNTGRCRELLFQGAEVYLEEAANPKRKTRFSLVAVCKNNRIVNIDSQAPNRVFQEAVDAGMIRVPGLDEPGQLQREVTYGSSRFDFAYRRNGSWQGYIEVKGVTLEQEGIAMFPDAPTVRGVRHLRGLEDLCRQGLDTRVCFIVQMDGICWFTPHDRMHPDFGKAVREAAEAGVCITAYSCSVSPDEIKVQAPIPVRL